jgi:hypothetical protein
MSYIDSYEPQPWIGGTGTYVGESKTSSKYNTGKVKGSTRYWDGTKWSKDAPTSIPMIELKPAYNNTSKPGATEDIPESNFSAGTSDVSGDESFA